jgi:hypothetical protein
MGYRRQRVVNKSCPAKVIKKNNFNRCQRSERVPKKWRRLGAADKVCSFSKNYLLGGKEIYILPEEFDSVPRFIVAGILQKRICF